MDPARPRDESPLVLVVEDDPDARANIRDILELDAFAVEEAGTAAEALARPAVDWARTAAVVLDRRLPDAPFESLLPELRRRAPDAEVIVVTGHADLLGVIEALRGGATDYIPKPLAPDALRASLHRAVRHRALRLAKRRSDAAFRTLVESAECLIVIFRPDRSIAYFSPFAERLTGYSSTDLIGRDLRDLLLPEADRESIDEGLREILDGRTLRGIRWQIRCRDDRRRALSWNVRLLDDYEGGPAVLGVGHDITGLIRAQERVLQSERLAAIGQMVAGLAHESRNALQRGQSCLEMLALRVEDRPEAMDLIRRAQQAQDHLHQLYEDVRCYASPIVLKAGRYDVTAVWREAWSYLDAAGREEAELVERVEAVDPRCWLDPFRMVQVFRNIMENALSASPEAARLAVHCSDALLDGRAALRISIKDDGPGLSAEQAERIFEPFFTTKARGTGLGMAITRRIVEAHGGRIGVGPPGPGAEILLTLPREQPS